MSATPHNEQSIAVESVQAASMRAMGQLASGRILLVLLISLAILFQVGLFAAAVWGDVLHKHSGPAAQTTVAASQQGVEPGTAPAESGDNFLQNFWPAATWRKIMEIGLPIAGVVAIAAALMLVPLTMLGVQVNLVGRLPATSVTISAFYWSVLTVVLMLPWGHLLGGVFAEMFPWVFCTYKEIDVAVSSIGDQAVSQGTIWLRFLVWPVAALLASWTVGARFGNAYWQVVGLAEMQGKNRGVGNG